MAFTPTVSTDLASQLVTLYANAALQPLSPVLRMGSIVNRNYQEGEFATVGQTINVPLPPVFTSNTLTEGGSVTQQENALTTAALTISSHQEASFSIPQFTSSLTNLDLGLTYIRSAIVAVASKVETDLLSLYASFTTNTAVGTAATALTDTVLRDARKALVKAKIPMDQPRYLMVHPDAYEQLLANTTLTAYTNVGFVPSADTPIQSGLIGRRYDLNVIEHQLVPQMSVGSPAVVTTYNQLITPDAIMLATRTLPPIDAGLGAVSANMNFGDFVIRLTYSYASQQLTPQWTVSCLYGFAVLRNAAAVVVKS